MEPLTDHPFDQALQGTHLEHRDYQLRIGRKAIDMFSGKHRNGAGELENAARSIIIEAPTGSGKTPMALAVVKAMQLDTPGLLAIWITMRRNLLAQAARENAPPSEVNPDGKNINADVEFMSMFSNTLPEHMLPENRNGRPLLFIADECQHDSAATSMHLHNELRPDYVLGASAFPFRTDRLKLVFEKTIKDAGIHELIQAGFLSEYEHFTIPEWTPKLVAGFYTADPERWGSSLAFFHTHGEAREFMGLVNSTGLKCDFVTAATDREDQLAKLKSGELDILVNCAIMSEGMNFPDLKTVWTRDSWKGNTIQMSGRVLRKSKLHHTKQIVQSKDSPWSFLKTAMPKQHWVYRDSRWMSLKINEEIDRVEDEVRDVLADIGSNVPEFMMMRGPNSKKRRKF